MRQIDAALTAVSNVFDELNFNTHVAMKLHNRETFLPTTCQQVNNFLLRGSVSLQSQFVLQLPRVSRQLLPAITPSHVAVKITVPRLMMVASLRMSAAASAVCYRIACKKQLNCNFLSYLNIQRLACDTNGKVGTNKGDFIRTW